MVRIDCGGAGVNAAYAVPGIVAETVASLQRIPGAVLLTPSDVRPEPLAFQLERALLERYPPEGIFTVEATMALAYSPGELLGRLLDQPDQPVEVPGDLSQRETVVVLVTGSPDDEAEMDRWLRLWSEHFRRFKQLMERGRGVRCIWVGDLVPRVLRRSRSLPEHWATVTWFEPEVTELENQIQQELAGHLAQLTRLGAEFLSARLLDMAGGRYCDLALAIAVARQATGTGDWLDKVSWDRSPPPERVDAAMDHLKTFPAVQQLLRFGGVVVRHLAQEWDQRWNAWEDELWGYGVRSQYGDLVGLSPLALQSCHRLGLLPGAPAAPPAQTTLRLLGRCLYWERLLKDRLMLSMSSEATRIRVVQALSNPSILGNGVVIGDPEEQVRRLTLGAFLRVLCQVLPGGEASWNFSALSSVRNDIAHGGVSTWARHWYRIEQIEKHLLRAYAVLTEERFSGS